MNTKTNRVTVAKVAKWALHLNHLANTGNNSVYRAVQLRAILYGIAQNRDVRQLINMLPPHLKD